MPIAATDIVQRSPQALAAEIDREVIVLDVEAAKYLSLNPVAAGIWQLLERPIAVADLCARLRSLFAAPAGNIENDVLNFLDRLESRGLLVHGSACNDGR